MTDLHAVEFVAAFPTNAQPYKPHGDGGGVVILEVSEQEWDKIPELHKAGRGRRLRVLVEVLPGDAS